MLPDGFFVRFFPAGHETNLTQGPNHKDLCCMISAIYASLQTLHPPWRDKRGLSDRPIIPLGRHWHHSCDKMYSVPPPPSVCIHCKWSKTGQWGSLGMRVMYNTYSCTYFCAPSVLDARRIDFHVLILLTENTKGTDLFSQGRFRLPKAGPIHP